MSTETNTQSSTSSKTSSPLRGGLVGSVIILLVAGIAVLVWWNLHQKNQMQEMVQVLEFEKEEIQDEYEDLAIQFDGYQQLDIKNDSLQEQLAHEQQRVRDLLEELRITKATDARRIAALKKELATVRSVMVVYVHQIDSLNRTNARLEEENKAIRQTNQQIVEHNTELVKANTQLNEVVTRAAMLEISDFSVLFLNKRDRKTTLFSQIQKFEIHYTIQKNITSEPGIKQVYMRLVRPDGEVMVKSANNLFSFENADIPYSVRQEIEYEGEALSEVMYWTVEEILQPGIYNADFFIDGNLVGSFPFTLKK